MSVKYEDQFIICLKTGMTFLTFQILYIYLRCFAKLNTYQSTFS